jgi:hypothetical protein
MPFDGRDFAIDPLLLELQRVRQRILDGWCQYKLTDADDDLGVVSVCLIGAAKYPRYLPSEMAVIDALYAELPWHARCRWSSQRLGNIKKQRLANWNDSLLRTRDQVVALVDRAIARQQRLTAGVRVLS